MTLRACPRDRQGVPHQCKNGGHVPIARRPYPAPPHPTDMRKAKLLARRLSRCPLLLSGLCAAGKWCTTGRHDHRESFHRSRQPVMKYETGIMVEGKTKDDFIAAGGDYDSLQPWQLPANFKQRGDAWIRDAYAEFFMITVEISWVDKMWESASPGGAHPSSSTMPEIL